MDFQADVDITPGGVFNPIDGTAKITGTFTMNSDATGSARIATLADDGSTSDVDGDITFERFMPSNDGQCLGCRPSNYVVDCHNVGPIGLLPFGSDVPSIDALIGMKPPISIRNRNRMAVNGGQSTLPDAECTSHLMVRILPAADFAKLQPNIDGPRHRAIRP